MLFHVIDLVDGEEPDMTLIASCEKWAKGLKKCDSFGFVYGDDGRLYLCGDEHLVVECPPDRFKVLWSLDLSEEQKKTLDMMTSMLEFVNGVLETAKGVIAKP